MQRDKRRMFFLAFLLTLALLVLIMVGTVMAVQPMMPGRPSAAQEEYVYTPPASDTLTLAVIGATGQDASQFLLIRFNPQYGQIPLTVLPANAVMRLEEKDMTLKNIYETAGPQGVKKALGQHFGILVDRYAVLDSDVFLQLAAQTGSVVFTLPDTVSYSRGDYNVRLEAGQRRLDGQDVLDLFSASSLEADPQNRSKLLGDLTAAIINQNLDVAANGVSQRLFKLAVNLVETDINSADYELRRESADFLSRLDTQVAGNIPVEGEFLAGGGFALAQEYVSLVRQYFQPAA